MFCLVFLSLGKVVLLNSFREYASDTSQSQVKMLSGVSLNVYLHELYLVSILSSMLRFAQDAPGIQNDVGTLHILISFDQMPESSLVTQDIDICFFHDSRHAYPITNHRYCLQ